MSIQAVLSAASFASLLLVAGCSIHEQEKMVAPAEIVTTVREAPKPAATGYSFRVTTDKPAVTYKVGEPVVFTVELFENGTPAGAGKVLAWERNGDDGIVEKGGAKSGAPLKVVTQSKIPGFIRLTVKAENEDGSPLKNGSRNVTVTSGAAVEPDKLEVAPEPADFDAFWDRQKARVKEVPLKVLEKVPVKVRTKGVVCYDVKVAAPGGKPMSGYLCMPENAKEKSLPATVVYFGYGVYPISKNDGMAKDRIVLSVNAHGFLNGQPKEYYSKLAQGELKAYAFDQKENSDPETTYFNGMMLRLIRSLEYVKSLPEWDGVNLRVEGHSQGGMQTGFAAGLDEDVTEAILNQPWMCDIGGAAMGHLRGTWHIKPTEALKYYDTIYHMRRYNGKVVLLAGLGDYVCPPFGMAKIFAEAKGPKEIIYTQSAGHHGNPEGEKISQKCELTE
ncbi:acetylxylan esterase [uncultured Victivallis sp.]|uniref:acetylxylan esterase n=1 Tax=uncultured Victivallis sp. TaxID=354118 RepID=UPI0025E876A5|nr:acetylxylan esterase [uncultured Victivallis sp.]